MELQMQASYSSKAITPQTIFCLRVCVAIVWLYEGLWLKLIEQAPHELAVVASVGAIGPISRLQFMQLIGAGETLLAVGVISGLFWRPIAWLQVVLLTAMNSIGIFKGGDAISDPGDLIVRNLPLVVCISVIGFYGPGSWALRWQGGEHAGDG
jgi:uncharacterized membrane protein YphA (DoxX/SURF4 family)